MNPHRIRLRGPWDCEPLPEIGRLRCRRRFQWVKPLDDSERLWLTVAGVEGQATIRLNGERLDQDEAAHECEFEITRFVRPKNELVIEMRLAAERPQNGGQLDVALEVREPPTASRPNPMSPAALPSARANE